jgi:hypothetical protein
MLNATIASVERVTGDGIVVKLADGAERTLANGDPMLRRMDLAYAINTHMAQGITASVVYAVMGSFERNLSNARSFLVNLTRQQDDVRIFTDDRDKLMRQIASNRGDKLSALETTGELAVEARLAEYSAVTRGSGAAGAGAQDKAGASSPANSLGEELRAPGAIPAIWRWPKFWRQRRTRRLLPASVATRAPGARMIPTGSGFRRIRRGLALLVARDRKTVRAGPGTDRAVAVVGIRARAPGTGTQSAGAGSLEGARAMTGGPHARR